MAALRTRMRRRGRSARVRLVRRPAADHAALHIGPGARRPPRTGAVLLGAPPVEECPQVAHAAREDRATVGRLYRRTTRLAALSARDDPGRPSCMEIEPIAAISAQPSTTAWGAEPGH